MIDSKDNEKLSKTLFKKAIGYTVDEVVEEYISEGEGAEMRLVKKKVTKKHMPPDISAAKALLESSALSSVDKYADMSTEELLHRREEILSEIAKGGNV